MGSWVSLSVWAYVVSTTQCLCKQWPACTIQKLSDFQSLLSPIAGRREKGGTLLCTARDSALQQEQAKASLSFATFLFSLIPPLMEASLTHRENMSSNNRDPRWARETNLGNTPAAHSCPSALFPWQPHSCSYPSQEQMGERQRDSFFSHWERTSHFSRGL